MPLSILLADSSIDAGLSGGEKLVVGGLFAGIAFIWLVVMVVSLALFIFWILMLVDAVQKTEKDFIKIGSGEKNIWIIVLIASLFLGFAWLSAILYYILIRKKTRG